MYFLIKKVDEIEKIGDKFKVTTTNGTVYTADFVVVNAGAHSLYLAHKMDMENIWVHYQWLDHFILQMEHI